MNKKSITIVVVLLLFGFAIQVPALAVIEAGQGDIEEISNSLLMKEIELLKLNTRLRMYLLPHRPWSTRRWSGVGITNSTLTSVGAFMNGAGRLSYLDNTKKAPPELFLNASRVRFLANCISMGGAAFESAQDFVSDYKEKRRGVDLNSMRKYATALQGEIDGLIQRRKETIEQMPVTEEAKALTEHEGEIFLDLRNAELGEFAYYYGQAKGNKLARQTNYLITFASNFASAAGTLTGIEASKMKGLSDRRRTHMGGVGGICDIVTGSMNIAAPAATRCVGGIQRRLARAELCEKFNCEQVKDIESLLAHRDQYLADLRGRTSLDVRGQILRKPALDTATKVLQKRLEMRSNEAKQARARFCENELTALVAGGSKVANGVGGTLAAFHFTDDAKKRFAIVGGTAIAYGVGNSIAAVENIRVQLGNELKGYKNHKEGKGTEFVLKEQLEELDQVSTGTQVAVKSTSPTM